MYICRKLLVQKCIMICDKLCMFSGEKVILWSFVCKECGEKLFKESVWSKHCQDHHPGSKPSRGLEFDNLWLMPGGGHIFMQMLKGALQLL